jgi:hypothetical protein
MTQLQPRPPGRNVHSAEFKRRRSKRNLALLVILLCLAVLLFVITTVRMGEKAGGPRSVDRSQSQSLK